MKIIPKIFCTLIIFLFLTGNNYLLQAQKSGIAAYEPVKSSIPVSRVGEDEASSDYDIIITNINLIDGTGDAMITNANIYILNGEISEITSKPLKNITSDSIINGKSKYIIPGLIDAHFHLLYGKGKFERSLKQLIHFGVTAVLIPGGSHATYENLKKLEKLEKTGQIIAPHLYYTSPISTLKGGHPMKTYGKTCYKDSLSVHIVKDTNHIKSIVREAASYNVAGIKIIIEDGPMPPITPRMSPEYISAFTSAAKKHDLQVFAHVSDMPEVKLGVENGVNAFMHFMGVKINWEKDKETIEQIISKNISWVTTGMLAKSFFYPLNTHWMKKNEFRVYGEDELQLLKDPEGQLKEESQMVLSGFFRSDSITMEAALKPMMSDIKNLYDKGVNVVLGTDVGGRPYILPGLSVHEEMQLLRLGGLTTEDILKISTHNSAKMLGISENYGTIEEGKNADMVILIKNPLIDISNTLSIETVIKDGKVQKRMENKF